MKNYYAVREGYNTGIYEYLEDARDQIRGYSGAEMKGFNRRLDAEDYLYEFTNQEKYFVYEDMIFNNVDECQDYTGDDEWFEFYDLDDARDHVYDNGYYECDERFTEDLCYTDHEGDTIYEVYTDGACSRNGQPDARGGVGIYFGANNPANMSKRLGVSPQTNQRAELVAIKQALLTIQRFQDDEYYEIFSDSSYAINCITKWYNKWQKTDGSTPKGSRLLTRS